MVSTTSTAPAPTPWKTLLLGGIIGYLIAVLSISGDRAGHANYGRILSEAGEQGEGEEDNTFTLDASITIIVLILVGLTIFFEYIKETIEEAADRSMEPVIEGLFGELTVLGFLSTVTFCFTKLGVFAKLGYWLFGHEEEELLEVFELVHFMLFFIMVFFGINVLVLMYGGKIMSHNWWVYNKACQDDKYMRYMDTVLKSHPDTTYSKLGYWRYLFRQLFPFLTSKDALRSELHLFRGLRDEFIAERSLEPPFEPTTTNRVGDDFDFGHYLDICQANTLAHMVHLSHYTWILLAVGTVIFCGVAVLVDGDMKVRLKGWQSSKISPSSNHLANCVTGLCLDLDCHGLDHFLDWNCL